MDSQICVDPKPCERVQKELFGRKRFILKLNNGKKRDLLNLKKQSEVEELKKLLEGAGISSKDSVAELN